MTLRLSLFIFLALVSGRVGDAFAQADSLNVSPHDLRDTIVFRSKSNGFSFIPSQSFNPMLVQPAVLHHRKNLILGNAYAGYTSNAVDVQLLKAAYNNAFITKAELDRVYNRSDNNTTSLDLSATAGVTFGNDTSLWKHGVYLQWRDAYGLNLSKGLAGLMFYGNAPFENAAVSLDGKVKALNYRKLQYVGSYRASPNLVLSGSIGLVQAVHAYDARMKGSVFTAKYGEFLDLDYDFDVRTFTNKRVMNFNGKGMIFGASVYYHPVNSPSYLAFGLAETGFMSLPATAGYYTADTTITFSGFAVGNVFGLHDSSFVNLDEDSVRRFMGVRKGNESFRSTIPEKFFLHYEYHAFRWIFGLEANYVPDVFPAPHTALHAGRWWNRFYANAFLHTVTYNTVNVGLCLAADFPLGAGALRIKAQTGYLNALVTPAHTRGLDAMADVSFRF